MKRRQKIYYRNYDYPSGLCPMIRISGKYLMGFGFNIGDSIEIGFETDHITITKTPEFVEKKETNREKELKKIREQKNTTKEQDRGIEQ